MQSYGHADSRLSPTLIPHTLILTYLLTPGSIRAYCLPWTMYEYVSTDFSVDSSSHFYPRDSVLARVGSLAMALCPSVCVCHKSVFYRNGWKNGADFWHDHLTYPTLYFKEIRVSSKIGVLPSGTLLQNYGLRKFRHYEILARERWSLINWALVGQLSWQYIRAPSLDRCGLSHRSSSSVYSMILSHGSISDSLYLSVQITDRWTNTNTHTQTVTRTQLKAVYTPTPAAISRCGWLRCSSRTRSVLSRCRCVDSAFRYVQLWQRLTHRKEKPAHWILAKGTSTSDLLTVRPKFTRRHDTIRDATLTCEQKPTSVSLIYRTEPTTKKWKTKKTKK